MVLYPHTYATNPKVWKSKNRQDSVYDPCYEGPNPPQVYFLLSMADLIASEKLA